MFGHGQDLGHMLLTSSASTATYAILQVVWQGVNSPAEAEPRGTKYIRVTGSSVL